MTSREIFLKTCGFGRPQRPYRWECVGLWETTLTEWRKQGYEAGTGYDSYLRYFGMEWNVGFMNFAQEAGFYTGFTDNPLYPEFPCEILQDEGRTRVVRTGQGIIQRELSRETDSSMPQFLKFPVETRSDWEALKLRLDPYSPERYPADWRQLEQKFPDDRDFVFGMPMVGAFGFLRNLLGPEQCLMAFYDDPDLVADILVHWQAMNRGFIEVVGSHFKLDYVLLWEDMCFRSAPLISPAMFRRFILPHYKEVISSARLGGIPVAAVDTDGQCGPLIPLFIEAGINLLFPLEVQAGMDPREVMREYGQQLAVIGGLDKRPLAKGKNAIDEEIEAKVPWLLEHGGYFPSLDHTAPPDIPLDNFKYFLERVRSVWEHVL